MIVPSLETARKIDTVNLLVSLGRTAQEENCSLEDQQEIERILDTLDQFDDTDGLDEYLRDRLY